MFLDKAEASIRAPLLAKNTLLVWKLLPVTETVTYYGKKLIAAVKSFITQDSDPRCHDTQHKDTQHNEIQYNDKDNWRLALLHSTICWVSCWIFMLCWMLLRSAVKLNVVMKSVIMLNVVAPWSNVYAGIHHMSQAHM